MKIFYYNTYDLKRVPPDAAIEADQQTAARIFAGIVDAGSFFGIVLSNDRILQIYVEQGGKTSLEILDRKTLRTETAYVTTPMAEAAIEAAFSQKDIRETMNQFFVKWTTGSLR